MATKNELRAAIASEQKKKTITLDEAVYYAMLKDQIKLDAVMRCIAENGGEGVGTWSGTIDELDEKYNDRCIAELPERLLD